MRIVRSRFVVPISSGPIDEGAVAIEGSAIREVGPSSLIIKKYPRAEVANLGNACLLPGLVNVHTHLELTHFGPFKPGKRGLPQDRKFVAWLIRLALKRRIKMIAGKRSFLKAFRKGLDLLRASGTTCFGDITTLTEAPSLAAKKGLRAVLFFEALGFDPDRAEKKTTEIEKTIEAAMHSPEGGRPPGLITVGLSPHAPYTVSSRLFALLSGLAGARGLPMAVHLAESPAETAFTRESCGEFVDRLYPLIGWSKYVPGPNGKSPTEYLNGLGVLRKGTLAVHAVHVDDPDREILRDTGTSVAHCPRSNRFLGVGTAPVKKFLDAGIPVGLGTDSLASNTTLSLWDEMRFAESIHGLPPATLLGMATLGGARALGMEDRIGSLEPEKEADMVAVSMEGFSAGGDLAAHLVAAGREDRIRMVMVAGREIPFSLAPGGRG